MLNWIRAFFIMLNAHKGQKDKAGKPYFLHPLRVQRKLTDRRAKVVALLHDVVEDSDKYGFDDFYCSNLNFNDLKISNPNKINILVIHGTLDGSNLEDMQYNSMSTRMLQEKGFDYVALGHIHKNNFKNDGKIIYPGSTIAMGFDELGEHGMVTGEISKLGNKLEFINL